MPVSVAVKVGTVPEIKLLLESFNVIVTVPDDTPSALTGPVPVIVQLAAEGVLALNTTVPPVTETGVKSCKVFVSAFVDFNVQVETPEALDEEQTP